MTSVKISIFTLLLFPVMASIPYTMHTTMDLHKKLTEEQTKNVGVIFEPPTSSKYKHSSAFYNTAMISIFMLLIVFCFLAIQFNSVPPPT